MAQPPFEKLARTCGSTVENLVWSGILVVVDITAEVVVH